VSPGGLEFVQRQKKLQTALNSNANFMPEKQDHCGHFHKTPTAGVKTVF